MPITHESASRNILAFCDSGSLVQSNWHERGLDGREIACLLGSIDPSVFSPKDCSAHLMPLWLAELTPILFDGLPSNQIYPIARRYGNLIGRWNVLTDAQWNNILTKFLVRLIDDAVDAARPVCVGQDYWPAVDKACADTKTALASGNKKDIEAAARAAETATWAATWAAARAAETATWAAKAAKATEAAARAAWAIKATEAAARAAEAAAYLKLFNFMLDCIETELTKA